MQSVSAALMTWIELAEMIPVRLQLCIHHLQLHVTDSAQQLRPENRLIRNVCM